MAFLQVLREEPLLGSLGVVWVRPSRQAQRGCPFSYQEILGQLRLALSRWESR